MSRRAIDTAWFKKRQRAEWRFRLYGKLALATAAAMLVVLLGSIAGKGFTGFTRTEIELNIHMDMGKLGISDVSELRSLSGTAFTGLVQESLDKVFLGNRSRKETRQLYELISEGAGLDVKEYLLAHPDALGSITPLWLPASSRVDLHVKQVHGAGALTDTQLNWLAELQKQKRVRSAINTAFFDSGDSRMPEQAGFLGAMAGSAFTMLICIAVCFPVGVMAAVYLEEFARKGKWVDLIEVNINNLAAVPSIVFGLLGLAVYINVMGMPRSAPLVGGLTLALMVLPVIIISTRVALKSVPPSIRDAARGLGASQIQVVWHHTLPLAMPGIMTGTILGMARAIGETAPLLMIGMVAFIVDLPEGFTDPATVMPVQIYLWASSPEAGFAEKTASGILVLLVLLLAMNALAIYLRKRFEIRW
ncbi:MAG: phosphate ABC transporter permease PstA [Alphaproteobacteria bacterium]